VALFSVISAFDTAYAAYNGFQQGIERYWTLRWMQQQGLAEIEASVMKDGLVRADILPLVFRVPGTESLPRNARIRARVTGIDLLTLDLHAALAGRLDEVPAGSTLLAEDTAEDEAEPIGALQLAIQLDEPAGDAAPDTGPPPPAVTDPA
jgi:exoribonuclease-2